MNRNPDSPRSVPAGAGLAVRTTVLALLGLLALAVGASTLACGGGGPSAGEVRYMSIGTGGTGGIYYPLGGALATRLSDRDPMRRVTAEVTGGSVENVRRVAGGEIDLGFSIGTTVRLAHDGGADFEEPLADLRIVAPLYPNLTHLPVLEGSDVETIEELRGRRVSVGPPGSGTEQLARQLLAAHGLGYGDLEETFLSFSESAGALRDGAIDAAVLSVGIPASAVLEIASSRGIRLLPVGDAAFAALVEAHPFYERTTIPAGAYPGVEEAVPTAAVTNWIVGRADLDGAVARDLLEILEGERDELVRVNAIAAQIELAALSRAPIPLHAAAEAWLSEGARPGPGAAAAPDGSRPEPGSPGTP